MAEENFAAFSFPGPDEKAKNGVLHKSEASYKKALADGHKDTPAPEAWEEPADEAAEKEALKAALKEAGIPFGGNSGLAKLRELAATITSK